MLLWKGKEKLDMGSKCVRVCLGGPKQSRGKEERQGAAPLS